MSAQRCEAGCGAVITHAQWPTMLCEDCYSKGIVWAAKQAIAAERACGGSLTLTVDPAAIWPGNCAPPTIDLGKQTTVEPAADPFYVKQREDWRNV